MQQMDCRVSGSTTPHMLRHGYATALIQSGENAKTVQTLIGHHSVAFTMDRYAEAWSEALSNAGEKAAALLFAASGSKNGNRSRMPRRSVISAARLIAFSSVPPE